MDIDRDASTPMATEPQDASSAVETESRSVFPMGELPVELLYRVARPLSTTEFCALRLTCRAVEQRLFQTFSREFFSRKQFMMSGPSLQALIDIAHHPHLSAKLEHVTIGLELMDSFMPILQTPREYTRDYRLGQEAIADQSTIFSSGRAVEMLTEALKNLPNLKTVSIRDAPSRTRFRDFNSGLKHWNSYGYPTLKKKLQIQHHMLPPAKRCVFSENVFSAVTAALARSAARPENIEMIIRDRKCGIPDRGFYIPPTEAERTRHKALMSGLRKLHLYIVLDAPKLWGRINERIEGTDGAGNAALSHFDASHYIAQTEPNLEWLRLNFHESKQRLLPRIALAGAFLMHWAYGGPKEAGAEQKEEEKTAYPKLKRLDLGFAVVLAKVLWKVLKNLPALEEISLHHITLSSEEKPELLLPDGVQEEGLQNPPTMVWQSFLLWLPRVAPNLKHVEISGPLEQTDRGIAPVVLGTEDYNFAIHVEADENLADECAKAAAQLSCKPVLFNYSDSDETDNGFSDGPEGEHDDDDDDDDSNDDEDEDIEEMEE